MPPLKSPDSATVRKILEETIVLAADFDAFVDDYFPDISNRLTSGMTRTERVNILLRVYAKRLDEICARLVERFPACAARLPAPTVIEQESDKSSERDPVRRRVLIDNQTEALDLDRYRQWHELLRRSRQPGHELILLSGARGQGHVYFLMRVELSLPSDPPRAVLPVAWVRQPTPTAKGDFFAALGKTLGCGADGDSLRRELQRRLAQRNLILLHPLVREGFEEPALRRYYTEWLPELLGEMSSECSLKCIQPVEWVESSSLARGLVRALGWLYSQPPSWIKRARQSERARDLLATLVSTNNKALPIYRLPDLETIRREHVLDFCRMLQLPDERHAEFVDTVLNNARTSGDILLNIADYLPHYRTGIE